MKQVLIDYIPQQHQLQLHNCKTSLVCVTGRQIGKTVCAVNEIIKRALINPNTRNWYITNDYKQAKRNVWDLFKKYIPDEAEAKFNTSELTIRLPNGSKIELIGVENLESLRGAAVNFAVLDEYADFPSDAYSKVIRPMFATTGGTVWFVGTPKGLGNDLYTKYTGEDDNLRIFKFPSCKIIDNKVTQPINKYAVISELQKAYDEEDDNTFKQEYLGDFTRPAGTVYSEWSIENFVDIEYSEKLPLHITFDFGVNDPTSVIWIQPHGSETRVIDYYEASNADIHHFIQVLNSKPYKTPDFCTGDIAGNARELTTGKSPIDILRKNNYFLRTSKIPSIAAQVRQTHQKIKGLYIDKKAERFRDCMLNYKYPEKKSNLINQSNEVPLHDEWSHGMRAFEYWAWNTNPKFSRIKKDIKPNSGAELMNMVRLQRSFKR